MTMCTVSTTHLLAMSASAQASFHDAGHTTKHVMSEVKLLDAPDWAHPARYCRKNRQGL